MSAMIAEYDPEARATYVALKEDPVSRTVSVSDLVMVDLDENGEPVGIEFAMEPPQITDAVLAAVTGSFPTLSAIRSDRSWLLSAAQ